MRRDIHAAAVRQAERTAASDTPNQKPFGLDSGVGTFVTTDACL